LPKSFRQSQNVTREKLPKKLPHEKGALKIMMKLTPVNLFSSNQEQFQASILVS